MSWGAWAHHPQWDDDGEEATKMQEQDPTFDHGKLICEDGIEGDREDDDCDRQEGAVVCVPGIAIHIQCNESLDDRASHECDATEVCLPTDCAEPTYWPSVLGDIYFFVTDQRDSLGIFVYQEVQILRPNGTGRLP